MMRTALVRLRTTNGHLPNSTVVQMVTDAGGAHHVVLCATRYVCFCVPTCVCGSLLRLRRVVSVPGTRLFNYTLLADVHSGSVRDADVFM